MTSLPELKPQNAGPEPQLSGPVDVDEMAFAIALFVAAANGKVAPPKVRSAAYTLSESSLPTTDIVLTGAKTVLGEDDEPAADEVPLAQAVSVIWDHYAQDGRQQAICARLVAFYSLMLRTRGALLGPWVEETDENPQSVVLAPAIVEAVATAAIGESGQFADVEFKALVQSLAGRDAAVLEALPLKVDVALVRQKPVAPVPVSDVVQQLSLHLFAFQACVTGMHDGETTVHFHVVEQLAARVAAMSGNRSLESLLARALLANEAAFPWLATAYVAKNGVGGVDQMQWSIPPHEVTRCELAILGSLLELLRLFLGDGVTLQILKSLWPLATLGPVGV